MAYWLAAYRAGKRGLAKDLVWETLPWVLGFGILGARLYHVLNYFSYYLQNWWLIPQVWLGGLGIWGGIVGGVVGLLLFFKFSNLESRISSYLDLAAPAVALAQAVGRLGNIWNGENLPYAYWEMGFNLAVLAFLIWFERLDFMSNSGNGESQKSKIKVQKDNSKIKIDGYLFFTYLFLYALGRFVLEFFRTDSPWIWGPLTAAQWISLVIVSIAILILRSNFNRTARS